MDGYHGHALDQRDCKILQGNHILDRVLGQNLDNMVYLVKDDCLDAADYQIFGWDGRNCQKGVVYPDCILLTRFGGIVQWLYPDLTDDLTRISETMLDKCVFVGLDLGYLSVGYLGIGCLDTDYLGIRYSGIDCWDIGYWDTGCWGIDCWDTDYWDTGCWDTDYWGTDCWDSGCWEIGYSDQSIGLKNIEIRYFH